MKFEFPSTTKCKLSSVNVRSERHGPELVPAVDLKLAIDASNDILAKFHPDLKASLYFKAAQDDDPWGLLDGIEPITDLPNLRFPKLEGPLKWDHSGAGYRLVVDYGLGGDSNLLLDGCAVNNFAFNACEGGVVELTFRVQMVNLDEHIIGKLATLVQHEVSIILDAPLAKDVEDFGGPIQNPFLISDPAPLSDHDPLTPEQALLDSVGAES